MKRYGFVVAVLLCTVCAAWGATRLKVAEISAPETVAPGQEIAAHITLEVIEVEGRAYLRPGGVWHLADSKLGGNIQNGKASPWRFMNFKAGDHLKYTVRFTVPEEAKVGEKGFVRFRVRDPERKDYAPLAGTDRCTFTVTAPPKTALTAPAGAETALPVAIVPTVAEAPEIDGKSDEALWSKALTLPIAVNSGDGKAAERPAQLKILTDRKNLYLVMRAEDPGAADRKQTQFPMHDGKVWINDALDCILTPDMAGNGDYTQFIADLDGQHFDCLNSDSHGFNPPWRSAAQRDAAGWTLEVTIPLDAVSDAKVTDGTVWRSGFFRCAERGLKNSGWTATMGSHNSVKRHGYLIFGTPGDVLDKQSAFAAKITDESSPEMRGLAKRVEAVRNGAGRSDAARLPEALAQLAELRKEFETLTFAERFADSKMPLVVQNVFPYVGTVAPAGAAKTDGFHGDFFPGEVRDFACNLTNVSAKTVTVRAGFYGVPADQFRHHPKSRDFLMTGIPGFPAQWFAPASVAAFDGSCSYDVLTPNPAGVWKIAPRETVQIFVRVRADGKAKSGEGSFVLEGVDGGEMFLAVLPVRFQLRGTKGLSAATRPFAFGWDYFPVEFEKKRPDYVKKHYAMLREYGFRTAMLSGLRHWPRPRADKRGNLVGALDFTLLRDHIALVGTEYDYWYLDVAIWEKKLLREDIFGLDFADPAYEKAFKTWFRACVSEMHRLGIGSDRLLVCPLDESCDLRSETIARWIKECSPETKIIADTSSSDMERVKSFDRYVDVWMPNVRTLRQKALQEFLTYLERKPAKRFLYYYCAGANEKLKHPYKDYTLHFHHAFARGFGGIGYWAGGQYYGTPWYRRAYPARSDTALLYPAEDGPVPSRRLAAWHRGVQDLWLLRETAHCYRDDKDVLRKLREAAQNAADYPNDPARAEELRQYCRKLLETAEQAAPKL